MDAVKEIEKFSKYLYLRICHVIIQSRQGCKIVTQSKPKPNRNSWFCVEITVRFNQKLIYKVEKKANIASFN